MLQWFLNCGQVKERLAEGQRKVREKGGKFLKIREIADTEMRSAVKQIYDIFEPFQQKNLRAEKMFYPLTLSTGAPALTR